MEHYNKKSIYIAFMIISFSCLLLFIILFWCNYPQFCTHCSSACDTLVTNNYVCCDSSSYSALVSKVDSIQTVINRIDSQYQQNIDTMVNKMNTWMGYWMTLLTFILMIVSIWQFLNVRNMWDEFKDINNNIDKKIKEITDKREEIDRELNNFHSMVQLLSSIKAINSLSDAKLNNISHKSDIKYCLDNIIISLSKIEQSINKEQSGNNALLVSKFNNEIVMVLPLIIMNVRESLYQVKFYCESVVDNIRFNTLQDNLSELERSIRSHRVISDDDKNEFYKLITDLTELSSSI